MSDEGGGIQAGLECEASLKAILKSQYHAGLAMVRQAVELYPDEWWYDDTSVNAAWQLAYHTLFFTHLYLQPSLEDFVPWDGQQNDVQYPDAIPGPPKPDSDLPLLPEPYSREEALAYWRVCDDMIDACVDALDIWSAQSGFYWYRVSKLEHQLINIRHLQHGAAQLADRLRAAVNFGVKWVGAAGR
ncbi:hypothetical protein JW905_01755 [bacterium]|nr:hypothetical protein [candidate division CSSED10-310 bacterium]